MIEIRTRCTGMKTETDENEHISTNIMLPASNAMEAQLMADAVS